MSRTSRSNFFLIVILGIMTTISPFAIDMYLPAFPHIAEALHASPAQISLSLSSYFLGLAFGQLFYGPLLDRYGRKRPVYFGLSLFILASIGCMQSTSTEMLIAFRFLQAIGGCVASVSAMAMVHDFFAVEESAKIFSLLMLVLSVSPLFAPSIGSIITNYLGWQWVFVMLAGIVFIILLVVRFYLAEGHQPDPGISLRPGPILSTYLSIFRHPQFNTYALAGALSFAGLLVYVTGSSIIFMQMFHVSATLYSIIFAVQAVGFIGASQVNVLAAARYRSTDIFHVALICQVVVGLVFLLGTYLGWFGLIGTVVMLFSYLSCLGFLSPNASALALAPFTRNAGSASALLGCLQIGISSLASTFIGILNAQDSLPIIAVMAGSGILGLIMLLWGTRRLPEVVETGGAMAVAH